MMKDCSCNLKNDVGNDKGFSPVEKGAEDQSRFNGFPAARQSR
jgi:hypothetical protein